jgi:hypothetical protein
MKKLMLSVSLCAMLPGIGFAQAQTTGNAPAQAAIVPVAPTAEEVAPINSGKSKYASYVWNDVAFGMRRDEVTTLHPNGGKTKYNSDGSIEISDVNILDKCDAEVNIYFDDGNSVDRVIVNGDPSMGGRCSDQILAGLAGKYGQPLATDKKSGSILAREGKVYIWNRDDGITMRFKKFSNGIFGGGGMLKASWELTYTKLADNISL